MGLFRKATRTAGRVAKNVAKEAVFGDLDLDDGKSSKKHGRRASAKKSKERREYEEYQRLKEKFEPKDDATMRAEWERYYEEQCEGECETCPYYDWCPDDFEDEEEQVEDQAEETSEDVEEVEEEPERELTEEEKAAKAAAEAGEENGKEHFKDIPDNKPKGPLSQDQQTEVKTTLSRGPMFSEVR